MLIDDLREVRKLRIQLKQLFEERERLRPSLASPRMDGMPRGGKGARLEAQIDLRTELEERIRRTASDAMRAEKRAREGMTALPPELYSLCVYYYIGGMSVADVTQTMNISRSTLYEWIDRLKVRTQSDNGGIERTRDVVI